MLSEGVKLTISHATWDTNLTRDEIQTNNWTQQPKQSTLFYAKVTRKQLNFDEILITNVSFYFTEEPMSLPFMMNNASPIETAWSSGTLILSRRKQSTVPWEFVFLWEFVFYSDKELNSSAASNRCLF